MREHPLNRPLVQRHRAPGRLVPHDGVERGIRVRAAFIEIGNHQVCSLPRKEKRHLAADAVGTSNN